MALKVKRQILKSIRYLTGSQCKLKSVGSFLTNFAGHNTSCFRIWATPVNSCTPPIKIYPLSRRKIKMPTQLWKKEKGPFCLKIREAYWPYFTHGCFPCQDVINAHLRCSWPYSLFDGTSFYLFFFSTGCIILQSK